MLGPSLFFYLHKQFNNGLKSKCKIFADDTSLFFKINDINKKNTNNIDINNNLAKKSRWTNQLKNVV